MTPEQWEQFKTCILQQINNLPKKSDFCAFLDTKIPKYTDPLKECDIKKVKVRSTNICSGVESESFADLDFINEDDKTQGKQLCIDIPPVDPSLFSDSVGVYEQIDIWVIYSDSEGIDLGNGTQLCIEKTVRNNTCRPMWMNYDFEWAAGIESESDTPGAAIGVQAFVDGVNVLAHGEGSQTANQAWSQLNSNFVEFAGPGVRYGKYVNGNTDTTFRACLIAGSYADGIGNDIRYDPSDLYAKSIQLRINGSN